MHHESFHALELKMRKVVKKPRTKKDLLLFWKKIMSAPAVEEILNELLEESEEEEE